MKAMFTTKIATVAATDEWWRPKLSWTKCAALKLSSGGLKMLSICSKGSSPGSRHLLQAPRGHLRSSAAPLLRGGRTRGAPGRTHLFFVAEFCAFGCADGDTLKGNKQRRSEIKELLGLGSFGCSAGPIHD